MKFFVAVFLVQILHIFVSLLVLFFFNFGTHSVPVTKTNRRVCTTPMKFENEAIKTQKLNKSHQIIQHTSDSVHCNRKTEPQLPNWEKNIIVSIG